MHWLLASDSNVYVAATGRSSVGFDGGPIKPANTSLPCLGSLHTETIMEGGDRTGHMCPILTECAIDHGKLSKLLLLKEILWFLLNERKDERHELRMSRNLGFERGTRYHRFEHIFKDLTNLHQTSINNFNWQFSLYQYMKWLTQMFISWLPSHHLLLQKVHGKLHSQVLQIPDSRRHSTILMLFSCSSPSLTENHHQKSRKKKNKKLDSRVKIQVASNLQGHDLDHTGHTECKVIGIARIKEYTDKLEIDIRAD